MQLRIILGGKRSTKSINTPHLRTWKKIAKTNTFLIQNKKFKIILTWKHNKLNSDDKT